MKKSLMYNDSFYRRINDSITNGEIEEVITARTQTDLEISNIENQRATTDLEIAVAELQNSIN